MDTFITDTKTVTLLLATLFTGLLAGIFFTWGNAVTPGIGKLDDIGYLRAFQNMNRAIQNPLFFLVLFGPLLFSFAAAYGYKSDTILLKLTLTAAIIYFAGVILVTIIGNVPLNKMLDTTDLLHISIEQAALLRSKFEAKWNNLNLIRIIASLISFSLLIISCLLKNNTVR
ncbi:DUF1772 domain-containing protein [Flavobacterium sp. T12S277]|uniref:anthrone oxygenase family protein n=1 Tax=Flavobacterium sp. T12S277 TaxID=3402752 RepID=UPI003AED05F1